MALYPDNPVLIIDDEAGVIESFEDLLETGGVTHILTCMDSREVSAILAKQEVECILMDIHMPYVSGRKLLPFLVENYPEIPVIVITGSDDVEIAVECIKAGASDYMVKPIEMSRLLSGVKRLIELRAVKRRYKHLQRRFFSDRLDHPGAFGEIVTGNAKMKSLFQYMEVIGASPEAVLITGETGVGKELFAAAIHYISQREGNFVAVNVAGLDDNMFSDTLFGHEKGAFTDAVKARSGMIQKAAKGTLFLDEIGDLSMASQVKLLRLLQEMEYYPLGSDTPKYTDARIIFATNCDLNALIEAGEFRKDLYHRMCVHRVQVPPLRERFDDIPMLVDYFLEEAAERFNKKIPTIPKELYPLLKTYRFPGNVRELRAMVLNAVGSHTAMMLSLKPFKEAMGYGDSNGPGSGGPGRPAGGTRSLVSFPGEFLPTLKQVENILIETALKKADGNQSLAARMLGVTRQALNNRLKRKKK